MAIIAVKMAVSRSAVNSLGIWRESYPLSGHSSGEDTNSIYTHIELPAKREAIRKLEAWVEQQKKQIDQQGGRHDSTEVCATGSAKRRGLGSRRKPWRKKTP